MDEELRSWIGRFEIRDDVAIAAPLSGMAATLDCGVKRFETGDEVPPLWHWTYFLPSPASSDLGADGHPKKGGFLPPIQLPRRMWAGSRIEFLTPIRVSDRISRRSTISDISLKEGRSGPLAFVKIRHEVTSDGTLAIVEEQDIVYREAPVPGEAAAASTTPPGESTWSRLIKPSPVLLFRYSALTFNSHRIHYDRSYAEREEGYHGLVVHGPLIATLLVDLLRRQLPGARLREFSFRALRPLIDTDDFMLCAAPQEDGTVRLWAQDSGGQVATHATARYNAEQKES